MGQIMYLLDPLQNLVEIGGPVVLILLITSILTVAVIFHKMWQFASSGVGRHRMLWQATQAWDRGDQRQARQNLARSASYLAPVIAMAMSERTPTNRLLAEAETRFARLESGFRLLDTVAQLAPLLGLFGTVLGMIDAFQALQDAGSQVDPSVLAGGIWVALLTTAAGLVVAMPAALALSWLDGRVANERVLADYMIQILAAPSGDEKQPVTGEPHDAAPSALHA